MRAKSLRITGVCAMGVALLALPAVAIVNCTWAHPCPCGDRDGNGEWSCGFGGGQCRCETDWDISNNWVCGAASPPDASGEIATIVHSNHGCCSNDDACSIDGDCSGTCDEKEKWLTIAVPTVTINGLVLRTQNSTATTDALDVRFESAGSSNTLSVLYVSLDATYGQVTMKVTDGVTIMPR